MRLSSRVAGRVRYDMVRYSMVQYGMVTRVSLNSGVEHELSLILRPVRNQILHFRGCSCAGHLSHSAVLGKAYQENTLDIALDTLPIFVFVSP